MTDESPWAWLIAGVVVTAVGMALVLTDVNGLAFGIGCVAAAVGSLLMQVTLIAAGVDWGLARHDRLSGK